MLLSQFVHTFRFSNVVSSCYLFFLMLLLHDIDAYKLLQELMPAAIVFVMNKQNKKSKRFDVVEKYKD